MHRYLIVLMLLLIAGPAQGLPSCPEVFSLAYDECEGSYQYDNGDRYHGEWKKGKKHGFGTYVWTNGHRYKGQWTAGKKSGTGQYTWSNGDKYVGEFHEGDYHGEGTLTYISGKTVTGEWRKGIPWNATSYSTSGKASYAYTDGNALCRTQ